MTFKNIIRAFAVQRTSTLRRSLDPMVGFFLAFSTVFALLWLVAPAAS